MREFNLHPFLTTHIGFDRLFNELERAAGTALGGRDNTYPPYNVIKEENGDHVIEVAVAGVKKSDIKLEYRRDEQQLVISYTKPSEEKAETQRQFIKKGLAQRSFTLSFMVADDLVVGGADLENGILSIYLSKVHRKEAEPLMIPIK